jgi:NADP-dependent aldehyde dehydrogenase
MVRAPEIKAVGFTGSLAGGRALYDLAAARPEPIPVYAEMGSLNPVFVSPGARAARGETVARGLAASVLMGSGQFCTKPGVAFVVGEEEGREFAAQVAAAMAGGPPHQLLNESVVAKLRHVVSASTGAAGVARVLATDEGKGRWHPAVVLTATSDTFRREHALRAEHFGPVTVVVRCRDEEDQADLAASMEGSLTASLFAEPGEDGWAGRLLTAVTDRAGRVIWDGYPTGVAVTHAMHHGGPYPATTAPAFTSVGTAAIRRFLRPVAYQGLPDLLLPPALQEANPLGIHRHIDGVAVAPPLG